MWVRGGVDVWMGGWVWLYNEALYRENSVQSPVSLLLPRGENGQRKLFTQGRI